MSEALPGWHGKLPTLGDFASRRLPHEFIEVWDAWLATGLAALKQSAPEHWLDAYLASPIWRFLILPGALAGPSGTQCWTGVLMPSVDRAGRYFPFTVATPLAQLPRDEPAFSALHRWLHQVEDVAADALQDDWTVPRLESELERVQVPQLPNCAGTTPTVLGPQARLATLRIDSAADVTAVATADALAIWQTAVSGQAFWWCEPDAEPGRLVVTRGLPAGSGIDALLGPSGSGGGDASGLLSGGAPGPDWVTP